MGYDIQLLPPSEHPRELAEIPEPPKQLWIVGAPLNSEQVHLTIVGSRKYTSYGKDACEELIAGLRGYDIAIVSGLAMGIDTIAHNAALDAGLHTIAVPGSGLSPAVLYPRTNLALAKRIIAEGGTMLSEFAPETTAARWTFPMRNRIMAGLSKATLVIESTERSGTRITARLATDYNRDVFAVPGNIFSESSKGTNKLIALGATPVMSSTDILLALGFNLDVEHQATNIDTSHLPPLEASIIEFLSEPKDREVVIAFLDLPTSEANVLLMKMEIAGLLRETLLGLRRT